MLVKMYSEIKLKLVKVSEVTIKLFLFIELIEGS